MQQAISQELSNKNSERKQTKILNPHHLIGLIFGIPSTAQSTKHKTACKKTLSCSQSSASAYAVFKMSVYSSAPLKELLGIELKTDRLCIRESPEQPQTYHEKNIHT